ncbi:MAG: exonuclease domain-containing protein [Lachnospiraceae bacterium]|nr:exonuclease domain-containing protein [Lachnospiraceae bacterium]
MNYIVLDLEWNQCPAGKAREDKALPFEIIEIGAVRLDASHQITGQFREIVKPQVYTSLHFRTKEIVALRAMDFANARTFPEVANSFFDWCFHGEGADGAPEFCTWGSADLTELQRNLSYHAKKSASHNSPESYDSVVNLSGESTQASSPSDKLYYHMESPFPFPLMYFDIQKIFSIVYEDRKSRKSLEYAVDFLNIPKEIAFHSALSDAIYTSLVMQQLSEEQIRESSSVDYFRTPHTRKEEIFLHYKTYDKFVSKLFPSRNQAMKDAVVTSMRCPSCGKNVQRKIRWFSAGSHNQFCLAWCPQHGFVKGKIRLRQNPSGMTYAVKTTKLISEEDARKIRERKEVLRVKRRLHRHAQ